MAGEIDAAVQAVLSILRDIPGLRNAPNYPPEDPKMYPVLIGQVTEATWNKESGGQVRGLHTIQVGVYVPRKSLPQDIQSVMGYGELIKDKLLADTNARLAGTVDTVSESITARFGDIEYYPGLVLLGWTVQIPVKIRSGWDGTKYVKM